MSINIFEQAARSATRISSSKGMLMVEDLWRLPLTAGGSSTRVNLDDIAKDLHKQLKETSEVSFVTPASNFNAGLQLSFDIVKHIIDVKIAERDADALATSKAETKQKLMGVLSRKQDQELENKSPEEIQAMINSL
jgi:hypothetical protein